MRSRFHMDRSRFNSHLLVVFHHLFEYILFGAGDPLGYEVVHIEV